MLLSIYLSHLGYELCLYDLIQSLSWLLGYDASLTYRNLLPYYSLLGRIKMIIPIISLSSVTDTLQRLSDMGAVNWNSLVFAFPNFGIAKETNFTPSG